MLFLKSSLVPKRTGPFWVVCSMSYELWSFPSGWWAEELIWILLPHILLAVSFPRPPVASSSKQDSTDLQTNLLQVERVVSPFSACLSCHLPCELQLPDPLGLHKGFSSRIQSPSGCDWLLPPYTLAWKLSKQKLGHVKIFSHLFPISEKSYSFVVWCRVLRPVLHIFQVLLLFQGRE